jgi:hypothetical protein
MLSPCSAYATNNSKVASGPAVEGEPQRKGNPQIDLLDNYADHTLGD